ncbi:hypothetical protein ACER0A_004850 [Haloimpatiens sp. FM7315]|uniref:hypothetical protein n=1 Tax=Haloimpatiens sp. FM7315 TaxID=3298609 RepID=UPI0035A368CC
MPVTSAITLSKGNQGMVLFGTRNDDSTVTLPDIGFNFNYNGTAIRKLYTSGNTWIGFGVESEQLCINRRDASYNNLFYAKEVEHEINLFRVRFEGNNSYVIMENSDLIWELSLFETGIIRLVIEKIPNNGTNTFVNPGIGTQTLTLVEGKSYIFTPLDLAGKNYVIQEGSYISCVSKYLMVDSEGVKNYQTINGVPTWIKIGELPLTKDMFKTFGVDTIPASMEGLVDSSPALYYYTDNPEVKENKKDYKFQILETVTSKPKVLSQISDFYIHEGKSISRIEVIFSYANKDSNGNDITTNGKIKIALSVDEGVSFLTYNSSSAKFEVIDINNTAAFLNNGITPSSQLNIDYEALNNLLNTKRKLRFAYIFQKPTLNDICKLRKLKILYN